MIARVVASESAEAQTVHVAMHIRGCRTATKEETNEPEVRWKTLPQGVKVPYG